MKPDPAMLTGLMVLADDDPRWKWDPVEQARAACAGGATSVQLRAKHATDRATLAWAEAIRGATRDAGVLFLVNDRFDLAWLVGADGVHLGQEDLPPSTLPDRVRQGMLVGRSTHTPGQLEAAASEPVDYVAFGPVFGTTSKASPHSARGEAALTAAAAATPRPLVAIGGIDLGNVGTVARAGAACAAVISAVAGADDPRAATEALAAAFQEERTG